MHRNFCVPGRLETPDAGDGCEVWVWEAAETLGYLQFSEIKLIFCDMAILAFHWQWWVVKMGWLLSLSDTLDTWIHSAMLC